VPERWYVIAGALALFFSAFRAWEGQAQRVAELNAEIHALKDERPKPIFRLVAVESILFLEIRNEGAYARFYGFLEASGEAVLDNVPARGNALGAEIAQGLRARIPIAQLEAEIEFDRDGSVGEDVGHHWFVLYGNVGQYGGGPLIYDGWQKHVFGEVTITVVSSPDVPGTAPKIRVQLAGNTATDITSGQQVVLKPTWGENLTNREAAKHRFDFLNDDPE